MAISFGFWSVFGTVEFTGFGGGFGGLERLVGIFLLDVGKFSPVWECVLGDQSCGWASTIELIVGSFVVVLV